MGVFFRNRRRSLSEEVGWGTVAGRMSAGRGASQKALIGGGGHTGWLPRAHIA